MSDTAKLNNEEENLKLLEGFTLLDDDFMTIVFDRNTEATELLEEKAEMLSTDRNEEETGLK